MESESLKSILGGGKNVDPFFQNVWQKSCAVFTIGATVSDESNNNNPLHRLIATGFKVTTELMSQTNRIEEKPLFFQNTCLLAHEQVQTKYGNADPMDEQADKVDDLCWPAFLDGCSVVFNHADLRSRAIADLCQDLQHSFPHAYANTYVTPRHSQAVPAHADDRDVFVVQLYGSKTWTVYQRVPIPYPYPSEQVGKTGLAVPDAVLQGPVLLERTLVPGDVLYLPRGYVHQAVTPQDSMEASSHVTVALATHDWSLAGLLQSAGHSVWTGNLDWRMAMPREVGRQPLDEHQKHQIQEQIDQAIEALRQAVTVESVEEALKTKYDRHNNAVAKERNHLPAPSDCTLPIDCGRSGPEASRYTTLESRVRACTEKEKAQVQQHNNRVGLLVSDTVYEEVLTCLAKMKEGSSCVVGEVETTLCKLTLLCVARRCVALGALAVVD